jgi:hypothetical protein
LNDNKIGKKRYSTNWKKRGNRNGKNKMIILLFNPSSYPIHMRIPMEVKVSIIVGEVIYPRKILIRPFI